MLFDYDLNLQSKTYFFPMQGKIPSLIPFISIYG